MAKVLLVGYIRELLEERNNILRSAGHHVSLAHNSADAFHAIEQELFDVCVLGFSIPDPKRTEMARAIKSANPDTKIIMIYFNSVKNTELADALLQTTASAEDVLRAINYLISPRNERTGSG